MHVSFTAALAAIDEMAPPLQSTILANPAPAQRAHQRFQELQRALNTEVVILLGVSVGFSDTEGTVVKGPASPSVRAAGQNPPLGRQTSGLIPARSTSGSIRHALGRPLNAA